MRPKLYKSREWLYKKYVKDGLSSTEIAELAGATQPTIDAWLKKFNIRKKR